MTNVARMSALYAPTLREDPAEAELASHRLLLRAGMIRKTAAGVYTFLPLAQRVLRKIENIVREEMDAIGSQEMLMTVLQPAELWHESGRWDAYGPELMRLQDRHGRDFCLGPTHEELITSLIRDEVRSYRDLPLSLYQVQVKFRDEVRPRFGLLRGREFIMKDAYSFHDTQESLQAHYDEQARAYGRICERMGLAYRPVEAESGQIGGKVTIEFMALAEMGEAALVYCDGCDYAANVEAASTVIPRHPAVSEPRALERVHTPDIRTIAELAGFLGIDAHDTVKTMAGIIDPAEGESGFPTIVFFLVPGDRELNPVKAGWAMPGVRLLEDEEFKTYGLPKGSLGPVGAKDKWPGIVLIGDRSLSAEVSWAVGANEDDYHLINAMPGRDFIVDRWEDLVVAEPGDACPACSGTLLGARGIEVGQVFQLGTKYSESMGATFAAEDGSEQPFLMGCYGWGVSRSLAAAIEQHNDEHGIVWPVSIAPYEVAVLPLQMDDTVYPIAQRIAEELAAAGIEVVLDDRDERAGVKFADADLIGFPYQAILGKKGVANGIAEVKDRRTGEREEVPLDAVAAHLRDRISARRAELA